MTRLPQIAFTLIALTACVPHDPDDPSTGTTEKGLFEVSGKTQAVRVINSATEAVPVSLVTMGHGITVAERDAPTRQPFQRRLSLNTLVSTGATTGDTVISIPAHKLLVIEHVSGRTLVTHPDIQVAFRIVGGVDPDGIGGPLPVQTVDLFASSTLVGPAGTGNLWITNQPVRGYMGRTDENFIEVQQLVIGGASSPTGEAIGTLTITGYLVDHFPPPPPVEVQP
jgi:hypothetical protein